MIESSGARPGLAEFLTELVGELTKLPSQPGAGDSLYAVNELTLELTIAYTLHQSADEATLPKLQFWVLGRQLEDAAENVRSHDWNVQNVVLRLSPKLEEVGAGEPEYREEYSRLRPARLVDSR